MMRLSAWGRTGAVLSTWLLLLLGTSSACAQQGLVALDEVAARTGMGIVYVKREKALVARLSRGSLVIEMEEGRRHVSFGGVRVFLGEAPVARAGHLHLGHADWATTLYPLLFRKVARQPDRPWRVMLDPGHGGKDQGAENRALGLQEKHLTLDVARRLKGKLEGLGFEVLMTRQDDRFVDLASRARLAREQGADYFVSIHFNATTDPRVGGVETYAMVPAGLPPSARSKTEPGDAEVFAGNRQDAQNIRLAWFMQAQMVRVLGWRDRGVKRARFAVLRELDCPGILVECGFLSNPDEAAKIATVAWRERLAKSLAAGFNLYREDQRAAHVERSR